jgi:hypothetical protein
LKPTDASRAVYGSNSRLLSQAWKKPKAEIKMDILNMFFISTCFQSKKIEFNHRIIPY